MESTVALSNLNPSACAGLAILDLVDGNIQNIMTSGTDIIVGIGTKASCGLSDVLCSEVPGAA